MRPVLALLALLAAAAIARGQQPEEVPLVTGQRITPLGRQVEAGSFPVNLALSPDGRFVVSTGTGRRQVLTVIDTRTGAATDRRTVGGPRLDGSGDLQGTYFGLAFAQSPAEGWTLFVSRGAEDRVEQLLLRPDGTFSPTSLYLHNPSPVPDRRSPHHVAGIALFDGGARLCMVNNQTTTHTGLKGSLSLFDRSAERVTHRVELPGYPFDVAAITQGPNADRKAFVTSERDNLVSVVDLQAGRKIRDIPVGAQPACLLLSRDQSRLYVACTGSDTISIIDTARDRQTATIPLRPGDVRGIAGATPNGMALSPDGARLYSALGDMNAVAVVDTRRNGVLGYLPVGWNPTAVAASPDGRRIFVANAKGVGRRNPNATDRGHGRHPLDILEGTVSLVDLPDDNTLALYSRQVIANCRITRTLQRDARRLLPNPGIKHVIYVIKENRTYDQVLGDLPRGNGDPALCLFPREVTPNQHALAERFVLLDNFYCCAEVSADGWQWSTAGMASAYTQRNMPTNYSDRGRWYDQEGQNSGVPVDLLGIPDVARPAGGYLWDLCLRHGVSFRNYGFYLNFVDGQEIRLPDGEVVRENTPNKRALVGRTNLNYRIYDMDYADSDAWVLHNAPAPRQKRAYGRNAAPSRIAEWRREYEDFVRRGTMPRLMMVRLPRNHTSGTAPGTHSPRAMVADNDYAVGQLVETVSKGPYWKETAILILEDDAQNGYDHVDAHRSIAFVISPYVRRGTVDSRFYNTDSMLRTIELLLGLPPMNRYDAIARPLTVFERTPANDAPYEAILPARPIIAEVNRPSAYRAADSARLLSPLKEETGPDEELNDILWRSIKGQDVPNPPVRHGFLLDAEARERRERARPARR